MKSRMHFIVVLLVKFLSVGVVLGLCSSLQANSSSLTSELWQELDTAEFEVQARALNSSGDAVSASSYHSYESAKLMTLNDDLMRSLLIKENSVSDIDNQTSSGLMLGAKSLATIEEYQISLPLPNGTIVDLTLVKDSVLPEKLAAKYPDIQTYRVLSNDLVFGGKVDISDSGFHAMLSMLDGNTVFIDPTQLSKSEYAIYNKSAQKSEEYRQHSCGLDAASASNSIFNTSSLFSSAAFSAREIISEQSTELAARTEGSMKNYTIAIATTGEYSAKFGGSVSATMAAITTSLNRVNQILERDLGIHLNLAENNDLLINTNANSDPFTTTKLLELVYQNQDYIDAIIGNANYDIGHLFTTSGGGLAAIGSVCNVANKAKGVSGISSPKGDSFDLDFVAHEIGHQLGATHTFNSTQGACSVETRTQRSAFEPGSGSSIMSYAGSCGLDNIQSSTDAMYHIGSIEQITEYTTNGIGNRCGVVTQSLNEPPVTDAGSNFIIPARTPFELEGKATDTDGDSLIYAWEQLDAGDISTESLDKGNNALFRVHSPSSSAKRSFPPLETLLDHKPVKGETLPNHERFLTMSFVAQDGFNAAQSDETTVKVLRTGSRFALNYPRAFYSRGATYPIYWNVADTDKAPINCSSVNVWLSDDGGNSFAHPIANNIPNTGEAQITIPSDASISAQGRFKLKCSDNIFFAISYRNFFIAEYGDSVSLEYDNEDQAEASLKDLPLDAAPEVTNSVASTTVVNNVTSSGGGALDFFIGFGFLLLLRRKYDFYNKQKVVL